MVEQWNADSWEPKSVYLLHLTSTNVDRGGCLCFVFYEINNQLRGFVDIEQ